MHTHRNEQTDALLSCWCSPASSFALKLCSAAAGTRIRGEVPRGRQGRGCGKNVPQYSLLRGSRLLSQERGAAPELQRWDKTQGPLSIHDPHHGPAPKARPHLSPSPGGPPCTREEVEKTAWGRGEGGLNLFWRTLAETIWADDMDAMLWRALSLETWSWGGERQCEAGPGQRQGWGLPRGPSPALGAQLWGLRGVPVPTWACLLSMYHPSEHNP